MQQGIEGRRIFLQNGINVLLQNIPIFHVARILRPFRALPVRLGGDDGQSVLQTDQIADFLKCKTGQPEIFKLSAAVD